MRPSLDATWRLSLLASACLLSACGILRSSKEPPTLRSLASQQITVKPDAVEGINEAQAIQAYRQFLDSAPNSPQSAEALRRLADLEMDRADKLSADPNATGEPDYRAAIARYQEHLAAHPQAPNRDLVLYQLARAQEQAGQLEAALLTLTQLVQAHPDTAYADEAQFRRGELLFSARQYAQAEKAYAAVLEPDRINPYRDRALYMQGWSRFKQGRLDEALHAFFGVLDIKLGHNPGEGNLSSVEGLGRAERELLEDTFRVISLCLTNLQGAESIASYTSAPVSAQTPQDARQRYAFHVYEQLGEFYLKQDRPKDAADTFNLFATRAPLDAQAPRLHSRVIEIYERAGFATLALEAKKQFVAHYGRQSDFRTASPQAWATAQPLVQTHLAELASHHHALAQRSKRSADYQEAVHWYRELLVSFPDAPQAARKRFLLAELLFEDARFAEAITEYEQAAYDYPAHAQSADAGYAALLSHAQVQKRADAQALPTLQRQGVASALRFAKAFPTDARTGPVLSDAAEKLYALNDASQAAQVAQQVLDLKPPAAEPQRRVAWTILAHTAFERQAFDTAEQAYAQVLLLTPAQAAGRNELIERQAAAVYKQGEQARAAGQWGDAVAHFTRVASVAPQSAIRANAQFDAAAALIAMKDWGAAAASLEDFRQRYPKHTLQAEVAPKLALAYTEQGQWAKAASELERVSAGSSDATVARDALWQAAEFHEKAGARAAAAKAYERHLAQSLAMRPAPLLPAIEARARLVQLAREDGNAKRELALQKDIYLADLNGGNERTDRTRYLGATAALALAEPVAKAYREVALVEPLQKQLKLKKARMEEALKAYALASEPGVADVSTAATYHIASLYRDFGKAMLASQRPRKLSAVELEQYNVMLEEQAFPFEEKASDLHEVNARRAATGIYDEWVQRSFDALREMLPVRYGKRERGEGVDTSTMPSRAKLSDAATALEQAVQQNPKQPARFNQLGATYRQLGQFDKARAAYEQAIAQDASYAPAVLNLGILSDLYLGDTARALTLYERYLTLTPAGDATVAKWVAEIKKRKPKEAS
ncbi:MAG TPA: tetratricopeptide repeat protein [Aquabacterium sp.]|uniref:tetratricopeptide repeat protein n=1 Tax=Aquabacterium sp. TaxID=1872578 RepID=UPI002E334EC7|nr:tetratricopeptide repeat protein [Aquabacterium sp.]HEX5357926.1 tetratricopeptide repeat protein [Aquabacterium sp.]